MRPGSLPILRSEVPPQVSPVTYIYPQTLTVLATYRCTAACEHCCFGSNPYLSERIGLADILQFIEEGASHPSLELLAFSGGECFLLGDDLGAALAFARSKGLRTRCVTNGYWAKSLRSGRQRLRELRDAGLDELNISTGDYHQRWVSEETVINAACLGVELGLDHTMIVVEMQKDRRVTAERLRRDPRVRALLKQRDTGFPFDFIESPWMPMSVDERIDQRPEHTLSLDNLHLHSGCHSIFTTVVVTPSRKIGFCCGLSRELIPELNAAWGDESVSDMLAAAGADFMKIWIYVDGPERIIAWLATRNPEIEWENRYGHTCHVCLALFHDPVIRKTIIKEYRHRVDDVLLRYSLLLRAQDHSKGEVYG